MLRGDFVKPPGVKKEGLLKKNPGILLDFNSACHNGLVTRFLAKTSCK